MALKFPYRRLFFKGLLRPKRLYEELELLDERITALEGSNSTPSTNDEETG